MEYLNSLTSNPSYELQLPYGTYIAAKMNAEVGTDYDNNEMVNLVPLITSEVMRMGHYRERNGEVLTCQDLSVKPMMVATITPF